MKKIRVLVANRSRLMRDLVAAAISDQPDIEVMSEIKDESEIVRVVVEQQPDFVIIALDKAEERPALCDRLLANHPQIKVLAMAPELKSSAFFWTAMEIRSATFESSEGGLLSVLRGKTEFTSPTRVH